MAEQLLQVRVVSAQEEVYQGVAKMLTASGCEGELGIYPGHTPLLTMLKAGEIHIKPEEGDEVNIYVQGGFLEVQPHSVIVLSDTAMRAQDIDEAKALEAKEQAEALLRDRSANVEYAVVLEDLAQALAQLRVLKHHRGRGS